MKDGTPGRNFDAMLPPSCCRSRHDALRHHAGRKVVWLASLHPRTVGLWQRSPMRKTIATVILLAFVASGIALAKSKDVHVSDYTRKDGTSVHAYDRSSPSD